jgi:agmatine deiminase
MSIHYPPEWSKQKTVWLSFPHNSGEWDKVDTKDPLQKIKAFYRELVEKILDYQNVSLLFHDEALYEEEKEWTKDLIIKKHKFEDYIIENNDIWIRDYGPFFMLEHGVTRVYDFKFNAWGEKFPPWDLDNEVPLKIATRFGYQLKEFDFILEGGALEFNGAGTIMTTKQCLLNKNRNPDHSQEEIEKVLKDAFNIENIIWLERGLEGDHTDGHIDDFARFISENKILLCQTDDANNPNREHLEESKKTLEDLGYELDFLPLPKDMKREGEYLPASYANFIFLNGAILIPTFNCLQDKEALEVFKRNFPDREILTIDSSLLIQEGGGLHCMSKQEPL